MALPRPRAAISARRFSSSSALRPRSATAQPPSASWRAISAPMPELAPTTMAWRNARLIGRSGSHAVPEQAPCDHQALDLRRALVDLHHARVAVVALDRVLLHVAVPAVHLDGLVRHPRRGLGGVELGHARGPDEVLAGVLEPRGLPGEQPGRRGRAPQPGA